MSIEYDKINFNIGKRQNAVIKVIGVGGGGSNAVNYMYNNSFDTLGDNIGFAICNTDLQALDSSPIPIKIQIGDKLTEGRGAGNQPGIGEKSANESKKDINSFLSDSTKMLFITAGMGGGTGTGAAPVIAKLAMKKKILTVAIVTIPFLFEGSIRYNQAIKGIKELKENVDSILIVNNEQIKNIYGNLTISSAFAQADNILTTATKGIAEIINIPGRNTNVNFADIETVVRGSGVAIMGSGKGKGKNRAIDAIKAALDSPLLNNNNILGAKNVLLNIASGEQEITANENESIVKYIQDQLDEEADVLRGDIRNDELTDEIVVTLIATGFENEKSLEFKDLGPNIFILDKKIEKDRNNEFLNKNGDTVEIKTSTQKPKRVVSKNTKSGFSNLLEGFFK